MHQKLPVGVILMACSLAVAAAAQQAAEPQPIPVATPTAEPLASPPEDAQPALTVAQPAVEAPAPATLVIEGDPPAAVFVDGEMRGTSPLTLAGLAPGVHELRLVRLGRPEERRTVELAAGATVKVLLDASRAPAPSKAAVPPTKNATAATGKKKSGGGKTWLIPVGVVVAGAGGAVTYTQVKPKNTAPQASFSVNPLTGGMAGLTGYAFDASASSDKDTDRLDYVWNFGDGNAGSGQTATHVYANAGSYPVSLVVYDGHIHALADAQVTVARNLAGRWAGTFRDQYSNSFSVTITMEQSGNRIFGTYQDQRGGGNILGSISATNYICPCQASFTIYQPLYQTFTFSGTVQAGASAIVGSVMGSGVSSYGTPLSLNRSN